MHTPSSSLPYYSNPDALELLRKHGLKNTSARLAILHILATHPDHALQAEQIYKELWHDRQPNMGTIYRTLSEFERAGVVDKDWDDGDLMSKARYFLTPAVQPPEQYRIVCRRCGLSHVAGNKQLGKLLYRLALQAGFERQIESLQLEGICNTCASLLTRQEQQGQGLSPAP